MRRPKGSYLKLLTATGLSAPRLSEFCRRRKIRQPITKQNGRKPNLFKLGQIPSHPSPLCETRASPQLVRQMLPQMTPQSVGVDSRLGARKVIRLFAFQQKPDRPFVPVRLGFLPHLVMHAIQTNFFEQSIHEGGSSEIRERVGDAAL